MLTRPDFFSVRVLTFAVSMLLMLTRLEGASYRNVVALRVTHTITKQKIEIDDEIFAPAFSIPFKTVLVDSDDAALMRLFVIESALSGRLDRTETWALRALEVSPRDPIVNLYLGFAYADSGRREPALIFWRKARAAPYFLSRARARLLLGDTRGALDYYVTATAILEDPGDVPTLMRTQMAWVLYAVGSKEQAESEFLTAINQAHGRESLQVQTYALGELGVFYVREGRLENAVNILRRALILDPTMAQYRLWLGAALKLMGDLDSAKVELFTALKTADITTKGYIYANLAEIYEQEGNWKAAVDSLHIALEIFPEDLFLRARYNQLRERVQD